MRTWGRITNSDGTRSWVQVNTTPSGMDDYVWLTTLAQALLLNLGESPFFADYGIPAHQTVVTQVFPDYYVALTQQRFAQRFASLAVVKIEDPAPVYRFTATLHDGTTINHSVPVPI